MVTKQQQVTGEFNWLKSTTWTSTTNIRGITVLQVQSVSTGGSTCNVCLCSLHHWPGFQAGSSLNQLGKYKQYVQQPETESWICQKVFRASSSSFTCWIYLGLGIVANCPQSMTSRGLWTTDEWPANQWYNIHLHLIQNTLLWMAESTVLVWQRLELWGSDGRTGLQHIQQLYSDSGLA